MFQLIQHMKGKLIDDLIDSLCQKIIFVFSCCVDYITAAHINPDGIIHFGPECSSAPSDNIPYLKVYEKFTLDIESLKAHVRGLVLQIKNEIVVVVDTAYLYQFGMQTFLSFIWLISDKIFVGNIVQAFSSNDGVVVVVCKIHEVTEFPNKCLVFVGQNLRKLENLAFKCKGKTFNFYK